MMNLLFSPKGRINSTDFMRGVIVLIVISAILTLLPLAHPKLMMVGMLGLILYWCWIVLYIKRLHDAGKSGWLVLAILVVFIGVSYFVGNFVQSTFAPDVKQAMDAASTSGDLTEVLALAGELTKKLALPSAISSSVVSYGVAFLVNKFLSHDPEENQYGPA